MSRSGRCLHVSQQVGLAQVLKHPLRGAASSNCMCMVSDNNLAVVHILNEGYRLVLLRVSQGVRERQRCGKQQARCSSCSSVPWTATCGHTQEGAAAPVQQADAGGVFRL